MSIMFAVSDVPAPSGPLPVLDPEDALASLLGAWPEACSLRDAPLVGCGACHPLVQAVHLAFDRHYPLVLSPDDIWICLAQGMAQHIRAHAEELRRRFVRHEGRVRLQVRRDDFVPGAADNPWPEVFSAFSDQIAAHIGKLRDLFVASFSTTTEVERAASELVLLDAMQAYFEYGMSTFCGIPSITLLGTPADWRSIRQRAQMLGELGMDGWARSLLPVLDHFVSAAEGQADRDFWRCFYKFQDGSGGPFVTGWINVLFPSLRNGEDNQAVESWREGMDLPFGGGPRPEDFPLGLSVAPMSWDRLGGVRTMSLVSGFFGAVQDRGSLAVRPALGWAVAPGELDTGVRLHEQPCPLTQTCTIQSSDPE